MSITATKYGERCLLLHPGRVSSIRTGLPGSHVGIHTWRVLRASWCGAVRLAPSFLQPPAGSPQMMAPQSMSPPCQVSMLVGLGARLHL